MKARLLIALFMFIGVNVTCAQTNAGYTLYVKEGKPVMYGNSRYLIVPVTLSNNTNQTLSYYSMSCSWWDLYKFDSKELLFDGGFNCDKNVPVLSTLGPHQQYKTYIELLTKKGVKTVTYKIGFNLINEKAGLTAAQLKAHKPNILWSNTLTVKI